MDAKNQHQLDRLIRRMDLFMDAQETLFQRQVSKLASVHKTVLTQEEAADYLGYQPSYLNQLTHHGKLKFIKKPGIKSKYFRRSDLDEYMSGESQLKLSEDEQMENEILESWKMKNERKKK